MNNFVFSVEQDLPRQLYIAGFRTVFLFEQKIVDTGNYITNLNAGFEEVFFNGTLNGDEQPIITGAKFSDIQNSLNEKAAKINAEAVLSEPSLSVNQVDPWNIRFALTVKMLIKDKSNLVLWNRTSVFEAYIPIENFEDPLYIISTNGTVVNKINKTIYQPFAQGTDVSNLTLHNANSLYTSSSLAPSFLGRLEGKLTANESGIESLVNLNEFAAPKDKCVVDYIYFSDNNPTAYSIQGMPAWFKLDDEHLDVYGVRDLKIP